MSQNSDLYGVTYPIPEVRDEGWGPTVTAVLLFLMLGMDKMSSLIGTIPILKLKKTESTLSAGSTLTQVTLWHALSGNGGPITLSGALAIANGIVEGALLLLTGGHAVNTVTILDGANTDLNGDIILSLGQSILLLWNGADWQEITRNS